MRLPMMKTRTLNLLQSLGVNLAAHVGDDLQCRTPITGETVCSLRAHTRDGVAQLCAQSHSAFLKWRTVPAPKRGELIRLFCDVLRANKTALGELVSVEAGKILQEGLGEVQEMIDICEFAVGLSRQLYGLTIASERQGHRMMEQWHPIGPVAVISAFNFPVAVWSWNAALALVCGDTVIWKPSEKTPLTALATQALFEQALKKFETDTQSTYGAISVLAMGKADVGEALCTAPQVQLVSATGSTRMGRAVAQACAPFFKRTLLELGGNNAMIVTPSADLEMAVRAITFSAVGTAGQRCTTLRRLIAHTSVADALVTRLQSIYANLSIGSPLEAKTLIGPLIDEAAYDMMQTALSDARTQGGTVVGGERVPVAGCEHGYYVRPAIVRMPAQTKVVHHETFAPILYVLTYDLFDHAMTLHNEVAQGLSSCIFTTDVREAETFMSAVGSDCGIANVNIGPSGAEIGGAFGGEKETGGGRESGSDAWKAYMRRQTNTINYSSELPLAQGIRFEV
jgi:aldehyde dehydrogenase (NAD+)